MTHFHTQKAGGVPAVACLQACRVVIGCYRRAPKPGLARGLFVYVFISRGIIMTGSQADADFINSENKMSPSQIVTAIDN